MNGDQSTEDLEARRQAKLERKAWRAQKRKERELRRQKRLKEPTGENSESPLNGTNDSPKPSSSFDTTNPEEVDAAKAKQERKAMRAKIRAEREARRSARKKDTAVVHESNNDSAEFEFVDMTDVNAAMETMKHVVTALEHSPEQKGVSSDVESGGEISGDLQGNESKVEEDEPNADPVEEVTLEDDSSLKQSIHHEVQAAEADALASSERRLRREAKKREKNAKREQRKMADVEAARELEKFLLESEARTKVAEAEAHEFKQKNLKLLEEMQESQVLVKKLKDEIKLYDSKMTEAAGVFEQKFSALKSEVERLKSINLERIEALSSKEKDLASELDSHKSKASELGDAKVKLQEKLGELQQELSSKDEELAHLKELLKKEKESPPSESKDTQTKEAPPSVSKDTQTVSEKPPAAKQPAPPVVEDEDSSSEDEDEEEEEEEAQSPPLKRKGSLDVKTKPASARPYPRAKPTKDEKEGAKETKPAASGRRRSVVPSSKQSQSQAKATPARIRRDSTASHRRKGLSSEKQLSRRKSVGSVSKRRKSRTRDSDDSDSDSDASDRTASKRKHSKSRSGRKKRKGKRKPKSPFLPFFIIFIFLMILMIFASLGEG